MLRYEDVILADRPLLYYPMGGPRPRDLAGRINANPTFYGTAGDFTTVPGGPGMGTGRRVHEGDGRSLVTADDPALDVGTAVTWEGWWYGSSSASGGIRQLINRDNVGGSRIFQWRVNAHRINCIIWPGAGQYYSSTWSRFLYWRHLATTYDGAFVRMYLDGKLDTVTARAGGSLPAGSTGIAFNTSTGSPAGDSTSVGRQAHFAFYDRVLSPAQINRHWRAGMAGLRGAGLLSAA